ncbi:MAG: DMT family transporter [Burkholderiaceae bacterium]
MPRVGLEAQAAVVITLATLMWGANAVAGQLTVGHVSPLTVVLLRWLMVASVMWLLYGAQVRAHWATIRPRARSIALMAVTGFTGFNALFYAAAHSTTAVNIGILQGSVPVFVLVGARLLYGTPISRAQLVGVLVAGLGVVAVATRGAPMQLIEGGLNPGDALMLLACVLYAGYTLGLQKRPPVPGAVFFTVMAQFAALAALPLWLGELASGASYWPTAQGWAVSVFIAIFPSCISQLLFMRGVDLIGPARAGAFVNLVPIFASLLAVLVLGELFAPYHAIGLALVIAGIWLAQRKPAVTAVAR